MKNSNNYLKSIFICLLMIIGTSIGLMSSSSANPDTVCGTCDSDGKLEFCNFTLPGGCGGNNGGPCGGVPCGGLEIAS